MTDGKWFWGGKARWEVEENDELERQDHCAETEERCRKRTGAQESVVCTPLLTPSEFLAHPKHILCGRTPYIPTPGLSRVGMCGSQLQEVVVIVASVLDNWVTTGRQHRDVETKREVVGNSERVEDVVANGGVTLNGCIEDEKEKGKWHTKSVNNISSQQLHVNFEADKVRVRVGWLAIGKMATISIMAMSQILVVFGLYYYSPARRTRMEEEDMEGIELEAGGGGAGNIRRCADFRAIRDPSASLYALSFITGEFGASSMAGCKRGDYVGPIDRFCTEGIVIQKDWQRERFLPPCEPPPNAVAVANCSKRPTHAIIVYPLQPIVFDLDLVLVLFPVVSKMQTTVARLLGERQRKSLLWPGQAVDEGLLAPEVWAQVSSCATRGRDVDVDCGIAEQVKIVLRGSPKQHWRERKAKYGRAVRDIWS
ncbi:hypothetical protein CPB84DRAFT_1752295 [Gymnopilus junonius]|uniref:Uncharacterized protein n=1 Tax=Gymnopilus junonius TaxID=109634 RepID=A0A9P5N9T0_GYMJU|nr:hypothetical protein CPB84DRAFT_1752295 [Gymnopilus junonius]